MALPSNPQDLANYDLSKQGQQKVFVKKVADLFSALNASLAAGPIAGLLNGSGLLLNSSLKIVTLDLGTITVNTTVNCFGATMVCVSFGFTNTVTVTLQNLTVGVPVVIRAFNASGTSQTYKIAASTPAPVSYNVYGKFNGSIIDLGVGQTISTAVNTFASGSSATISSVPTLILVAN